MSAMGEGDGGVGTCWALDSDWLESPGTPDGITE